MKKLILVLLLLGAIGAVWYGYSEFNRGHKDMTKVEAVESLTSTDLMAAFRADEDASNVRFNGKVIDVTGEVVAMNVNSNGQGSMLLDTGDPLAGVSCEMSKGEGTEVSIGSSVKVRGECTGMLMDVVLVRCVLVE